MRSGKLNGLIDFTDILRLVMFCIDSTYQPCLQATQLECTVFKLRAETNFMFKGTTKMLKSRKVKLFILVIIFVIIIKIVIVQIFQSIVSVV